MNNRNYNFQKLTPITDVELKIYGDALNFVFENDDIKNVAISGAYSAGKSSIIETYKSTNSKIRCLHISLAHFESTKSDADQTSEQSESVLEGKILNQLIHQIDPAKIPQTNFKVKQKISEKGITRTVALITIFLMLVCHIVFFDHWSKLISSFSYMGIKKALLWTTNSSFLLLSGTVCVFIFSLAVHTLIKTQKNKSLFKKVSLQGNEIEIFEESNDSYFDKYLNEVLYLFENSNADVIVFEDMDRYNINQIFERLREVNTLVNNQRAKENEKPIRFFYLLRDDIFVSKDRTKFFDFIIPIVPVIDGSNSYDQFIELFKKGGIYELIDESFLQGISLYVDDMRILKNIYNEFVIYHNRIQFTELNSNKLLAMLVYKNIFPRDFSDLQLSRGFVNTLFESKRVFISKETQSINEKIKTIEKQIYAIDIEVLESIDELDATFLLANHNITSIDGKNISTFKTRTQLIKAIKDTPTKVSYYSGRYIETLNMTTELQQLLNNPEYVERKKVIEMKAKGQIEKLKAEIQMLKQLQSTIENNKLKDIITKENIDAIFGVNFKNAIGEENTFNEIKSSPYFALIKYLIRNGFIDETYPDYMTYFYENSLSRVDKIFLRSVTDQQPKEYTYQLKNSQMVVSRLRIVDFDYEEILNFDLLCYLLKTKKTNQTYLTRFLLQLKNTKNYKFIGSFIDTKREQQLFIESINNFWSGIFNCILTESDFTDEQKKLYAIFTLCYSTDVDIEMLNENKCLSDFISHSPTFLEIDNPDVKKIIDGLSLLGVKFTGIDYDVSNKELFREIYENCMYQLTFEFISLMLKAVYGLPQSNDFNNRNYTMILSKPDEPLVQYVNGNINSYIRIVLDNCEGCINDDESIVLGILNNQDVDSKYKEEYICFLQTKLEHLENVEEKDLWSLLLQKELVNYSEANILYYFFCSEKGLDTFLVEFINGKNSRLNFETQSINCNFGEKAASQFFSAVVTCDKLSNEKYTNILSTLKLYYTSFAIADIPDDKIEILIYLKVVQMSSEALEFMRVNYPDQLLTFIKQNISTYTDEVVNEENFILDEMLSVLELDVNDKCKINLLQLTGDTLSINQKGYSDEIKMHILNNNLDTNDIPFLLSSYLNESNNVKEIIEDIAIKHVSIIIDERYPMPIKLFSKLLLSNQLTRDTKIELFVLILPNMNELQCKTYLSTLQLPDYLSLFEGKRPKFRVNNINQRLLTTFEKKYWLTSFDIDKDDENYYRAYGRKKRKKLAPKML